MAKCTITTPDPAIDAAFALLPPFLAQYKLDPGGPEATYPGVCGYGIDQQAPVCTDTRDNRWLVWAARYQEPDDDFLLRCGRSILEAAFDQAGNERRSAAGPVDSRRWESHHQYVWWLLQVALAYMYTGDTSLDTDHIRRMVETLYRRYDPEDMGITHTELCKFVTSIGEPANTGAGQAYSFFHAANNVYSLRTFAALAEVRGDQDSRSYFLKRLRQLEAWLPLFRDPGTGFYYALREVETGRFAYRVAGPEKVVVMSDNVYFPVAFGVLPAAALMPSIEYLEANVGASFPYAYAYPPYQYVGCGLHTAWWLPRSWQEPLAHFVLAMREIERPMRIYGIIRKQAERFAQDGEVWEHYDPDTGEPGGRRGYSTTSACLNIAIVEGLFGIRPASPGFARVSVRPAFPPAWTGASIDLVTNGRGIRYVMQTTADHVSYDFGGTADVEVDLLLPLPPDWVPSKVSSNVKGRARWLRGERRPCFEATFRPAGQPLVECRAR